MNKPTKRNGARSPDKSSPNNQPQACLSVASRMILAALLTKKQVAETLQVCPHTVARYTRAGLLPCIKLNQRVVRYDAQVVQAFIRAGAEK